MDKPISYKGTEPYIFVSYAHRDSAAVWPIIARMQADGYRVWYDDGIDPGTEWDENIASHVEGCGYFIAFLSPAYLASENCRDELNFARDLGKERLLIYLSDVTLPAGMRMRLSRLQAIHWYTYQNEDKAFVKLYEAQGLDTCRGKADQTSAPPPKAPAFNPDVANAEALYQKGKEYDERKDFSNAFSYYLKAAQLGYAPAQNAVAVMYESGKGVPCDKEAAVQWYHKAAEQGDVNAQCDLGCMYLVGDAVPRNEVEAICWFRKAAEQGLAVAQFFLGWIYESGGDVPQNTGEAVRWYQKAAEQGYAIAQRNLGVMYTRGAGVPQNKEEAARWFQKAAEQGDMDAQRRLDLMHAELQEGKISHAPTVKQNTQPSPGCSVSTEMNAHTPTADKIYQNGLRHLQNNEFSDAFNCFLESAEMGYAPAQNELGKMYQAGQGIPQDSAMAAKWFRQAAEQGDAKAQYNLGWLYHNGFGVPQNKSKAIKWFQKAAEQNNSAAQYRLWKIYDSGDGITRDKTEAIKWLRKAAKQGNSNAQYDLGMLYYNGDGVRRDKEQAKKWFQVASKQGNKFAQSALKVKYF